MPVVNEREEEERKKEMKNIVANIYLAVTLLGSGC